MAYLVHAVNFSMPEYGGYSECISYDVFTMSRMIRMHLAKHRKTEVVHAKCAIVNSMM